MDCCGMVAMKWKKKAMLMIEKQGGNGDRACSWSDYIFYSNENYNRKFIFFQQ
jgi:hypothetical protein